MEETRQPGQFIVFEGIDGSGKSTQIRLLESRLRREGISCYRTHEPTDSPIGSLIHQIMTGRMICDNRAVAALFAADRIDHLTNPVDGLCEKIEQGVCVLCDRYYFSSYAYHSVDIPMEWVISINDPCTDLLRPTVTVFLDLPPEEAVRRIAWHRDRPELYENIERLEAVRENYFQAFDRLREEEDILIVDASQEEADLEEEIWLNLEPYFR